MSISLEKEGFIFDMGGACKYHTRLMSGRLKRTLSLPELSALTVPIEETLSLSELPRFVEALAVDQLNDARVHCRLTFSSEGEYKVRVVGQIDAEVQTQCQRCLNGLPLAMSIPVDWRIPEDLRGEGDDDIDVRQVEVRLLDWIEDDLQLGIPLFAKHADEQCGGELAESYLADATNDEPDVATPFDGLKDLLSKQ